MFLADRNHYDAYNVLLNIMTSIFFYYYRFERNYIELEKGKIITV